MEVALAGQLKLKLAQAEESWGPLHRRHCARIAEAEVGVLECSVQGHPGKVAGAKARCTLVPGHLVYEAPWWGGWS